ncbi:cation diffusion facilitator family transporter [Aquimarina muelleri]|uniref:Cobalt transporter n=1 Tax=Aquimarina muelleri TaxID=279356 RepID=A0A918JVD3_9FLAO|nr:cation diffusion facilitator family transporter [Aquimarina muelleri]MCX2763189.1 cation diffusion facilitator family transporter [Aquimarina muelleri]GGX19833.1 cobalt transporter [Aquimarina muelleri]
MAKKSACNQQSNDKITKSSLLFSILLNIGITVAQIIGGLISGSLSLLSDALHNFSDVLSLTVSFFANRLSKKEASIEKTFGFKRAEIMAAFINSFSLIVIAVILIIEGIKRFKTPQQIDTSVVIVLSLIAIFGNGLSVLLLKKDSKLNMNMRSAYLHLVTDLMASLAVLLGGLLMKFYSIFWIDSILTFIIAIYLIIMGYDLLKKSFKILMLYTPDDIEVKQIVSIVNELPNVKSLHHIHIWQLNEDETHLEAHIDFNSNIKVSEFGEILYTIEVILQEKFKINHVTLQPEYENKDNKDIIVQD